MAGEPLAGKSLLIWHDEGFGDQIMMARLLPQLAAAELTWAVMPPLLRLFRQFCPTVSRVGEVSGRFDYWVPAMSLPARIGLTLEMLPAAPYLSALRSRPARGRVGVMGAVDPRQGTAASTSSCPGPTRRLSAPWPENSAYDLPNVRQESDSVLPAAFQQSRLDELNRRSAAGSAIEPRFGGKPEGPSLTHC
jgi:hypothetical protein